MFGLLRSAVTTALTVLIVRTKGQTCGVNPAPGNGITPVAAPGYHFSVVANGLTKPRSIQFDDAGNLLVLQVGKGIVSLQLDDAGGACVWAPSKQTIISNTALNHGMTLSTDGRTLFASDPTAAYSWAYNPLTGAAESQNTVVTGMNTDDHTTRTLLVSEKLENTLLISRGSTSNIDPLASNISTGHSQIKVFDLGQLPTNGYQFDTDGLRLGWGLRNSVGVAEHPETGGLYSVENSADDIMRDGVDVHQNNPGEEMNFHGTLLSNTDKSQGSNYGYPECFAAWDPSALPDNTHLVVGSQFALNATSESICARRTAPRLTFQAHMAPLDIKFNSSGDQAWVTFHGSWDRTQPVGYKVSLINFANGEPVAPAMSTTSYTDILTNADNSKCPNACFRPVGMAFDRQGRLFVSSDDSGEIYVLVADAVAGSGNSSSNGTSIGVRSALSKNAFIPTFLL
ncbi:hypothetical protein HO133_005826 [Letharia lupina]|uniref:Pyrroloquinoline quinone-dependent pyranose dehydrogenase beta-propeller domain-containing protein n=1 Tax=Letharia lupina TaxID=560253 RepID=A0A8H6C7P0_9LECA|nr:uncharacterized protein HO133_005826 [Letharia lupina]KAF6218477.1 hypothetical protein HO133_005826 [Letharia lupina]